MINHCKFSSQIDYKFYKISFKKINLDDIMTILKLYKIWSKLKILQYRN